MSRFVGNPEDRFCCVRRGSNGLRRENTRLRGFQSSKTPTNLLSYRDYLNIEIRIENVYIL